MCCAVHFRKFEGFFIFCHPEKRKKIYFPSFPGVGKSDQRWGNIKEKLLSAALLHLVESTNELDYKFVCAASMSLWQSPWYTPWWLCWLALWGTYLQNSLQNLPGLHSCSLLNKKHCLGAHWCALVHVTKRAISLPEAFVLQFSFHFYL